MSVVRLEREASGLAVASFDSPPLNLFNRQMFEDLRRAVKTFLAQGPGHAEFQGR